MDTTPDTSTEEAQQLVERVQELQARLESSADSPSRDLAEELTSAVVQMYGAGLERIVASLTAAGPEGDRIASSLAGDSLVATLLLIHDLHPVPLEQRVQAALDLVRPYMESHGGNVELLSIEHGLARIHLRGSCSDCSASSVTLELAVKQALEDMAPDLLGLEVEGVAPQAVGGTGLPMATGTASSGTELPMAMSGAPATPAWFDVDVDAVGELADGSLAGVSVAGSDLVVANVEGALLAYHDRCAGCGAPLRSGLLSAGALACPSCARSFFLPGAGRSMDDERVQLAPVPLLREDGRVKVALAG
ncbi:MAG TPA: NifU family protein [Solirubrobacteraceae bacterium]